WGVGSATEGLLRSAVSGVGGDFASEQPRDYLLDVSGVVEAGELHLSWQYSGEVHEEATVRRLADDTIRALREIAAHCAEPGAGGRTPSDFPLAHLDQSTVDRETELARVLAEDRATGLDLATDALLRVTVARYTDEQALLLWTWHHVLLDGWSLAQVFTEVCEQYAAIVGGRRPNLVSRQ